MSRPRTHAKIRTPQSYRRQVSWFDAAMTFPRLPSVARAFLYWRYRRIPGAYFARYHHRFDYATCNRSHETIAGDIAFDEA